MNLSEIIHIRIVFEILIKNLEKEAKTVKTDL